MSKSEIYSGNLGDFGRGIFGVAATILAAITANMEHVEVLLRCLLHATGIAVGIVTIWSIIRRSRGL